MFAVFFLSCGLTVAGDYVDSWILLRLVRPLEEKLTEETFALTTGRPALDSLIADRGVLRIDYAFNKSMRDPRDPESLRRHGIDRTYRVHVLEGADIEALVEEFSRLPSVDYAEPDYLSQFAATTPDDVLYGTQWNLPAVSAPDAWDITTGGPVVITTLPTGERTSYWNNHWTRNLIYDDARNKLFLSIGAATNINADGNDHPERAAIWELNTDGSDQRIFASGLRNPVGMDISPHTGELWTTVNERDGLGENTPPDYLTRVIDGADYGWPYVYFGKYPDPTHVRKNPERVAEAQRLARVPDLALGAHTVPLGLLFYRGEQFPQRYRHGAFVVRRGGVSRANFLGLDVIYLPFENGLPTGRIEPFLTGFVADSQSGTVHGRPVGIAMWSDGSLLVTDDAGGIVWRISYAGED